MYLKKIFTVTLSFVSLLTLANQSKVNLQIENDWIQQELVTRQLKVTNPEAVKRLFVRGRKLVKDLRKDDQEGAVAKLLQKHVEKFKKLQLNNQLTDAACKSIYLEVRWALRHLAFKNRKLNFDQVVFTKRKTPRFQHQCGHRVGESQAP